MIELFQTLQKTIAIKAAIDIIYNGGSQPGAIRKIYPQKITDTELRAICAITHKSKLFKLDKISLPTDAITASAYIEKIEPFIHETVSFLVAIQPYFAELSSLGWNIQVKDHSMHLFDFNNKGKIKKNSSISIDNMDYEQPEFDVSFDRPWSVHSMGLAQARTFKNLGKAIALFIEQAKKYSPNNFIQKILV